LIVLWSQPVRSVIKQFGMMSATEHDRKVAFRQWSSASQCLREAIEKIVMVAHDERQISNDAFDLYSTSCTHLQHTRQLLASPAYTQPRGDGPKASTS